MKILFLSTPIKRDGAPLRLKEILEYLKSEIPHIQIDVIANRIIGVNNIYQDCSDSLILTSDLVGKTPLFKRILSRIQKKNIEKSAVVNFLKDKKYDIFYANSIATLSKVMEYKKYSPESKIILHLRELETISLLENKNLYSDILKVDKIIAISKSVYDFAVNICKVPKDKVLLAYSGTHLAPINSVKTESKDKFIVGGIGGMNWRKGIDFFLILAQKTIAKRPDILFEWIGISEKDKVILDFDLKKMGIENNVIFNLEKDDVITVMNRWSVFVSVAREEPLGVACIEAGALGLPVLAFRKSGGPEEILSQGGGLLSEYLNMDEMSANLLQLMSDEHLYKKYSDEISKSVQKYDINISLSKIKNLIIDL